MIPWPKGKTIETFKKKLLENTANTCPVHKSLHPDIEAPISIVWAG